MSANANGTEGGPARHPTSFGGRIGAVLAACILVGLVAGAMASGTPGNVLAQGGAPVCDLHTLHGSYIFTASGYNIVGGVPQPKAIVEPIDFNGDGTLSVPAATVSINGNIIRSTDGVGVYTLDAACRGTLTFTAGPSFDLFADHPGKQAWMIQTNPGSVFQGTVEKVSP